MNKKLDIQQLMEQHMILAKIIRENNKIVTDQGTLTVVQFYLLSQINSKKTEFETSKFSKKMDQNQSSVSAIISRMVRRGYLTSTLGNDDRRKHEFKLTDKGQQLYKVALNRVTMQMMDEYHLILKQLGINTD